MGHFGPKVEQGQHTADEYLYNRGVAVFPAYVPPLVQ